MRASSEYDHEQSTEFDVARHVPENTITRLTSDDWHDKRGARFATPEASVLTVCNTGRYWAGRTSNSRTTNSGGEVKHDETRLIEMTTERPYRVAIYGYELHRALEILFGIRISLNNNVWIWPFKQFITYETQIRQHLSMQQNLIREMEKDHRGRHKLTSSKGELDHTTEVLPTERSRASGQPSEQSDCTEDLKLKSTKMLEGQLQCLVQFMDEDMKEFFSVKQKISNGTLRSIAFDYLWLLFQPGDLILTSSSQRRAYRVLHVTGGRAILDIGEQPLLNNRTSAKSARSWEQHEDQGATFSHAKNTPFIVDAFYIDFDGDGFGPVPRKFVIQEFEGEHPIDTLPAFPARFESNFERVEKMLAERGERFEKMAAVAHKRYSGLSAREPSVADWQEEVRLPIFNGLKTY